MYSDTFASTDAYEASRSQARPIPSFLKSLYSIVNDGSTEDIISWNAEGTSFTIHDVTRFSAEVLPQYYKHSNFSSFSRQLNFYSFKKVVDEDEDAGYLLVPAKPNTFEYRHRYFQRGRPDLLYRVVRKTNQTAIKEIAAEEKADRARRKRDEEMLHQLTFASAASLVNSMQNTHAHTSPYDRTDTPSRPVPHQFAQIINALSSVAGSGASHTPSFSETTETDRSGERTSRPYTFAEDAMEQPEPNTEDRETQLVAFRQLVELLSGSLSGLQGNLQSLLSAGAAVIPLLACQSNAGGTDFNELLSRATTTETRGEGGSEEQQGQQAAADGSMISPAALSQALGSAPQHLQASYLLSALAARIQPALGCEPHGAAVPDIGSPGTLIASGMRGLSLAGAQALAAGRGAAAAPGEEEEEDGDDDDEVRALKNMRLRSRVRRRVAFEGDSHEPEDTPAGQRRNRNTFESDQPSLADRRRAKKPRQLDMLSPDSMGRSTCDSEASSYWNSSGSAMKEEPLSTLPAPPNRAPLSRSTSDGGRDAPEQHKGQGHLGRSLSDGMMVDVKVGIPMSVQLGLGLSPLTLRSPTGQMAAASSPSAVLQHQPDGMSMRGDNQGTSFSSMLSPYAIEMLRKRGTGNGNGNGNEEGSGEAKPPGIQTNNQTAWDMVFSLPTPSGHALLNISRTPIASGNATGWMTSLTPSVMQLRSSGPGAVPMEPNHFGTSDLKMSHMFSATSPHAMWANARTNALNGDASLLSAFASFSPSMLMAKLASPRAE